MDVREKLKHGDHWERSLFLARCAQAVSPLFDKAWPDALPERKAAVKRAVELTLAGARSKQIPDGLDAVCLECRIVAGKALRPLYPDNGPFPLKEPGPKDDESCRLAHCVINAAGNAADSLGGNSELARIFALHAYGFAVDAAQRGLNEEVFKEVRALIIEFEAEGEPGA